MRRFLIFLTVILAIFATALPALAQDEDPLANSILLPNIVGWALLAERGARSRAA